MKSPAEVRAMVEHVTSYSPAERERIYQKHFAKPSSTARFLCEHYGFDHKRILDVACHYGYHLVYFGEGSVGLDGSPQYLQFGREMGLEVHEVNFENRFPELGKFDGLLFSGTLEEIFSPHVTLMRFREFLKPDGLLVIRTPTMPPLWFERIYRLRMKLGYVADAHLYFYTPRALALTIERAGYDVLQSAITGVWMRPWLRPLHNLVLPLSPVTTIIARVRPNFKYPPIRSMRFLPEWAADLAPYHQDYEEEKSPV
jgi:SAM-dependent methyltransferase